MNILRAYKRTRFFLVINIIGLAIGLAVSIMLILFVVNELSYDKHFPNYERIIRLNSVKEEEGKDKIVYGINLRKAYTEIPGKVPGIEASTQVYNNGGSADLTYDKSTFSNLEMLMVDPEFFKVFKIKFIEGTPETALSDKNSIVITRKQADIIFGSPENAFGKTVKANQSEITVSGVVEDLPANTHFSFDVLTNIQSIEWLDQAGGLEFYTYYLIDANSSVDAVSEAIVKEYQPMMDAWGKHFQGKAYGAAEKLEDIYMNSEVGFDIGKRNSMSFIWLLSVLAILILFLAIANFINLFIAQGEIRMPEIGIRKANGALMGDIVRQFFSEVSFIVLISFAIGLILTILLTPYFSELIDKDIDLLQLLNPWFIVCVVLLFAITVLLSSSYPSFYLSHFSPLDIIGKRIKFSKQKLTVAIVIFQSVITIVLISYILLINRQSSYLENIPLGYNPKNVMILFPSGSMSKSYPAIKDGLLSSPQIEQVSYAEHVIGMGWSGQGIGLLDNREKNYSINENRIGPGLSELMEFQLKEGEFFKENAPDSLIQIVLNEAAVKMLGLEYPVAGKYVNYKGNAEVVGVVKDFYYQDPAGAVQPLVLSKPWSVGPIYIRFGDNITRISAENIVSTVLGKFDPDYVLDTRWSEDIHLKKFENLKTQSNIILMASCLSMFIAMMGLVAVHLYATARRTKEIAIRRVNGATTRNVFALLSYDITKWVVIAGIFAVPLAYYFALEWISGYTNRTTLGWSIFILPVVVQCIVAIIVTSGVSLKALSRNPVESLKTD